MTGHDGWCFRMDWYIGRRNVMREEGRGKGGKGGMSGRVEGEM